MSMQGATLPTITVHLPVYRILSTFTLQRPLPCSCIDIVLLWKGWTWAALTEEFWAQSPVSTLDTGHGIENEEVTEWGPRPALGHRLQKGRHGDDGLVVMKKDSKKISASCCHSRRSVQPRRCAEGQAHSIGRQRLVVNPQPLTIARPKCCPSWAVIRENETQPRVQRTALGTTCFATRASCTSTGSRETKIQSTSATGTPRKLSERFTDAVSSQWIQCVGCPLCGLFPLACAQVQPGLETLPP